VRSAFPHDGVPRRLVHLLKYRGVLAAADLLGAALLPLLGEDARVLVPLPRVWARRIRYGTDPAVEIARALSRRSGLPVARLLDVPPWWPRQAGRSRSARAALRFRVRGACGPGAVLLDDVVTTGGSLEAAFRALACRPIRALTATARGSMDGGAIPSGRVREVE